MIRHESTCSRILEVVNVHSDVSVNVEHFITLHSRPFGSADVQVE